MSGERLNFWCAVEQEKQPFGQLTAALPHKILRIHSEKFKRCLLASDTKQELKVRPLKLL